MARSRRMRRSPVRNLPQSPLASTIRTRIRPPDGTFRPNQYITRAEAMTLVNRVLNRLPENSSDLLDSMIKWPDNSDASQWFYLAVQEATNSHYYKTKENKFEKWTKLRETRDWTELEK